ncbi:DUF5807 family protein [Halorubrum sp. SY-15]|jgi:hypothetical protein|uniref:DUF5807 family protein n=1 Tax=Halorubrum sp. SY-15 TaxID=3402277 RepID=UPI003EBA603A
MSDLAAFLAGDRLDDVVLYLSDVFLDDDSRLRDVGTETDDGVRLVLDGETGRDAFAAGTGMDAMSFAGDAMGTSGVIARSLDAGACPDADADAGAASDADAGTSADAAAEDHAVRFLLAFAEAQNEAVGGRYADGDVIHAYAHCACGARYADRWVVGERDDPV